ncbi:MAG: glycoside hydrolase family 88 protein [Verrucomicrobia subdivision 3 bacterium]|nr:glycoside hydrolase family 88 protein [Verrucomicrobiota bacterium]MCC6822789.1 glycoside hydrolase family 88 protein [Limisphaerales bacterium]
MPINIDQELTPKKLVPQIECVFELSGQKILSLEKSRKAGQGTPVFTVKGKYASRGWTEWTQGFQYGSALLQFDAIGDERFLEIGRRGTVERMASHVSHVGVHDHGFNNVSTYGNLLRLMREGKISPNADAQDFYELALKVSGAVQAARWTKLADGTGFIHSFNGPHSLFVDTIRSCRSLAVAHQLGHVLMGEQDEKISLLQRLVEHALNTARYSIYYGQGRDTYDVRGRTAHEAVFNPASGVYRCPNSQQGYSPFSTWTRGLAWALCGYPEQLEFLRSCTRQSAADFKPAGGVAEYSRVLTNAATATADFYLENSCADGVPMWDTGAPSLHRLPANYINKPSDPYNKFEPVDGSAAAIAAQGLIRLGNYLNASGDKKAAAKYRQAGLSVARTLFSEPYLSTDPKHQGLLLHSVYHRPNGWDYIAPGQSVPNGESSMWGDYHLRELALLILREARGEVYLTFFGGVEN